VVHRRWIGILLGTAFSLISLLQIGHAIAWLTLPRHGRAFWNVVIFDATFCVVFALLAAAGFLWARSTPKSADQPTEHLGPS
jgi:hypothetical protein